VFNIPKVLARATRPKGKKKKKDTQAGKKEVKSLQVACIRGIKKP
jgi:hypothetical protein